MRLKIRQLNRKTQVFLIRSLTTHAGRGSELGAYLRRILRKLNIQQVIGINLASFAFVAGIVVPQTQEVLSTVEVTLQTHETIVVASPAPSTYQWPMTQFGVSQRFSYYHPGMDLTDPIGTPVYPIAGGTVEWIQQVSYGYGKHMLIAHDGNIKSLYAHLSEIFVEVAQQITKETEIGRVGTTGRSTGSHLHLEIYEQKAPINPIDILPLLKFITPTIALPPKT